MNGVSQCVENSHPFLTSRPLHTPLEGSTSPVLGRETDEDTCVPEKSRPVSQAEQWEIYLLHLEIVLMCLYL